ncbi:Crp/Fnr family transcriptional regulator [Flavobacterium subsaxonicum]|uniref:Cyclic nucleotide-binding protein n=1 Tax=Flavobacterium subsaxonicum WB 4.1-42 = DSM 21790 TaxID=1121898 RepID=A0A0A2MZF0_9FLAO|nr:Crp/Fnr family transcriptional regulator [Flavobacterium subsaxonicum]KGO93590.1 cyclic nucleotide-binding protein [Flavobacterium subsaxonicum WB 4.1-42 = DSM 21790]
MFEVFEKYLRTWNDLSDEDLNAILEVSIEKSIRKSQSILHDGEVWKMNCFIAKGCFRLYRFGKDGVDHTMRFGVENWWMTDQESYNNNTPSIYNIEALATSHIIMWKKEEWEKLLSQLPNLRNFQEKLSARAYEISQQRIYSLISNSAEEKYVEFQKTYPNVLNKVPLYMVASYLGMSRETLSRVRKDYSRKQ